jgi:hypothetical protein
LLWSLIYARKSASHQVSMFEEIETLRQHGVSVEFERIETLRQHEVWRNADVDNMTLILRLLRNELKTKREYI